MNKVPLAKVARFINGRAFKPEEWCTEGFPIIRIQNLTGTNEESNYFNGEFDERYLVKRGDILISWSASLGVYEWQGNDAILNQHIFKVQLKKSVDKRYFFHAANDLLIEMSSHVHGSTMQHITKDKFDALEIPLPRPDEQKRIAAILDKADRLRRQRRFAEALSDSFLQSVFIKKFGDPVSNPMSWKSRQMGDEVESMQYGPRFYNEVYSPTGVRIIRITDLDTLGSLSFENMPTMTVSDSDIKTYALKQGDLIFARSGATVGKTALIPEGAPVCIAGAYFITMRFKKTVHPVFARNLFASKPVQAIIEQKSRQSAQQNFSGPGLRDLPFPLPPLPLQQKFAEVVQKFERVRRQQREATRQAEHLFQTLLHRAFRGRL